jgi:hypothetical protein
VVCAAELVCVVSGEQLVLKGFRERQVVRAVFVVFRAQLVRLEAPVFVA